MRDIPMPKRVIDIKRKRRIRRLRFFIVLTILFLLIIGGSAYFSFYKKITIDKIIVVGTSVIDPTDVIKEVEMQLRGKYFYLYNKSNTFIYPEKKIYDNLISTFPRIEELSIVRYGFNTLNINIKERLGSYLYCGSMVPEVFSLVGENCYFINNDGYIFDKAPYFSGNVYFKFYVKIEDELKPLGQNVADLDRFHELVRFIEGISLLHLKPTMLVVNEDGSHFLYLDHDSLATKPVILFKKENDLENILSNLSTAMNKKEFRDEINSKYSSLLYIDLRFKSKVLYKFQ